MYDAKRRGLRRGRVLLILAAGIVMSVPVLPVRAQELGVPGCGPVDQKLDVKTDKKDHPVGNVDGGKAIIYFLQDDRQFLSRPRPTVRLGIDGQWVGATHADSYFHVAVDSGVHHLCADWQASVGIGMRRQLAALHFTAEPGKVYYFRAKNFWQSERGPAEIKFTPVDSDEGQLLISGYSYSTSQTRK